MKEIQYINSAIERIKQDRDVCKLWLDPSSLNVKQIKDTINIFNSAVMFSLDLKTGDDYVARDIAALTEDVLEMNSISEEEKDKTILEYVDIYKKQLEVLAKRVVKKLNIDIKNCNHEINKRLIEGL